MFIQPALDLSSILTHSWGGVGAAYFLYPNKDRERTKRSQGYADSRPACTVMKMVAIVIASLMSPIPDERRFVSHGRRDLK